MVKTKSILGALRQLSNATLRAHSEARFKYPYRPPPHCACNVGNTGAHSFRVDAAPSLGTKMTAKRR